MAIFPLWSTAKKIIARKGKTRTIIEVVAQFVVLHFYSFLLITLRFKAPSLGTISRDILSMNYHFLPFILSRPIYAISVSFITVILPLSAIKSIKSWVLTKLFSHLLNILRICASIKFYHVSFSLKVH